jgi:hypothetical protein
VLRGGSLQSSSLGRGLAIVSKHFNLGDCVATKAELLTARALIAKIGVATRKAISGKVVSSEVENVE